MRDQDAFWQLFFGAIFMIGGLLWAVYPERMLRWHVRRHEWVADEPSVVVLARWLGIFFVIFGGVFCLR